MEKARSCLVSFLFLVLASYIPTQRQEVNLDRILHGLLKEEEFPPKHHPRKVAIGFGSCVDVVTGGVELFERLGIAAPEESFHNQVISSDQELAETFAFFFERGSASERYVSNSTVFQRWIEQAKSMAGSRLTVGGNAPVMANRFAMEGWRVLLGANMKQESSLKLHRSVTVTGKADKTAFDDYHLVLEFDLGEEWERYKSPRANRFIVHNDYSNMMLESMDGFAKALHQFKPSLVIIGGLQMLDNFCFDLSIRTERIKRISELLKSLPSTTKIHFEMASFTEERLLLELMEYVMPYADSLGMNEQELADLCSMYEHGNITVASDPFPRVASTLDRMRALYGYVGKKRLDQGRPLSRIHVHTLAYQAIFITKHSDWQHINSAVAKASLTAYRHVCASKVVDVEVAKVIMDDSFTVSVKPGSHRMPLVDSAPVSCWGEEHGRLCVAPNLVCTTVHQTAGGGDNVSAAGLVLQL